MLVDGLRTHHGARERVVAAVARADDAGGVDDGDAWAAIQPKRLQRHARVVVRLEPGELAAGHLGLVVDLVGVRQVVDQPDAQRLVGRERALIDESAHVGFRLLPAIGNAAHELFVQVARHRLGRLAMGLRVALLGEGVVRGLVLADVQDVRVEADLVERPAQEHLVGRQAVDVQAGAWHQEDLVAGGRDEVLALAGVLEVRDGLLAGLAEVHDGVVHLLHLRPERRLHAGRHDEHGLHPGVGLGLAQVLEDRAQAGRPVAFEQLRDALGGHFVQIVVEAQHQRGVAPHGRRAANREVHDRDARHRDGDRQEEQTEDEPHTTLCHCRELP